MKRLAILLTLAGTLAVTAPAHGQNRLVNPDCNVICSPVFVNQSSAIITNFIDAPDGADTDVEFLARVTTAFGTQFNPLFIVGLIQWTPFATAEDALGNELPGKRNAPVFVYGPGFHTLGGSGAFVDIGEAANYVALDLLPLIVYSGSAEEPSDYTHKLALEADFFLHIGKVLDPNNKAPFFNAFSIHAILDYLTDALGTFVPEGTPSNLEPSRWVLIVGLTTPIAPIPGG
jgi:hypothetical protein